MVRKLRSKCVKFGLPSTIDADSVLIISRNKVGALYSRTPKDVSVSTGAETITINLDTQRAERSLTDDIAGIPAYTSYTIVFKQTAGISNPTKAGGASVTVTDADPGEKIDKRVVPPSTDLVDLKILSKVTLKPKSGPRVKLADRTPTASGR